MASLQKHVVSGHTYWRIVESHRVNGKPRPVPILYLGTADSLLQRLLEAPAGRLTVRSYQHGDVAALKAAADRVGIVSIIDRHIPGQRGQRPSVGTTLLLGALNRAVKPRSKRGWSGWAAKTSLHRLFPGLKVKSLTSQFFWDQMDRIPLDVLRSIEGELTRTVVGELGLDLDTLFYDTTNFFTYIASTNTKSKLAQRGRSKQKRSDLRLFGLALLVSREGQIPLYSHVYEGNQVDSGLFPDSLSRIRERLAELSVDLEQLTVVYDKGNLSKANQALVDEAPFGYVASLTPAHHRDLMAIGLDRYRPLGEGERLRAGQIRGLRQHLEKRLKALAQWKEQLTKPRSGPRSAEAAQGRIDQLLSGQHLRKVLHIEYNADRQGGDRLEYWVDDAARRHLETEVFGKRIVATNRDEWSTEEILLAYRGQSQVEAVFRQLKDDEHLALRPQYHWTDQKIHVHAFICLLALLLARIVEHQARDLGSREGLSGILEQLGEIRLAMMLRPSGKKGGRPRADWQLEAADPELAHLFRALVPDKPPFVYTDGSA